MKTLEKGVVQDLDDHCQRTLNHGEEDLQC